LNRTKSKTLATCALSNINYFTQRAQCVLLFLVLAGNFARFRILHSYTPLLKSPVLVSSWWVLLHAIFDSFQLQGKPLADLVTCSDVWLCLS